MGCHDKDQDALLGLAGAAKTAPFSFYKMVPRLNDEDGLRDVMVRISHCIPV